MPPYERLKAAERRASQQFPDATRVRAVWTPTNEHEIAVEIWDGDRAVVLPVVARV